MGPPPKPPTQYVAGATYLLWRGPSLLFSQRTCNNEHHRVVFVVARTLREQQGGHLRWVKAWPNGPSYAHTRAGAPLRAYGRMMRPYARTGAPGRVHAHDRARSAHLCAYGRSGAHGGTYGRIMRSGAHRGACGRICAHEGPYGRIWGPMTRTWGPFGLYLVKITDKGPSCAAFFIKKVNEKE